MTRLAKRLFAVAAGVLALAGGASTTLDASTRPARFEVGLRVLRLVDYTRVIHLRDGRTEPRTLVTYVRYPAIGRHSTGDLPGAPPALAAGPYPLLIFGHGFAVTPAPYARLLRAWARAGYVVAAPVFPLENANAPGGPNESDLVNQPADMSFVITRLLLASSRRGNPLNHLIDPARVAVSGQSDGGETALVVAYDSRFDDSRVRAAVLLSGAEIPNGLRFPPDSPPLLATQGTADTVNPPNLTDAFFRIASRPKFLLTLLAAAHFPPYSYEQPQLGIVERATIAFLDHYLKKAPLEALLVAGNVPAIARLTADP
jgi:dienelactone hydrolase